MAFAPIALTIPQYEDFPGHWIKFFFAGTTNPKKMATDFTGDTQLSRAQLNSSGFPTTDGRTLFIPFVEDSYDLFLFPTEAAAADGKTTNAIRLANNINNSGLIPSSSQVGTFNKTLEEMITDKTLQNGDVIRVSDRANGLFDIVDASTVSVNSFDIINLIGSPSFSAVLNVTGVIVIEQFGANNNDDARPAIQRCIEFAESRSGSSTITSNGSTYTLKSTNSVSTYGGNTGLLVTDVSKAKFNFNGGRIKFDETNLTLGGISKDSLISLAPTSTDKASGLILINIKLSGGDFADESHKPNNVIKSDYFKLTNSYAENIDGEHSQVDTFVFDASVMLLQKCTSKFSGVNGSGFKFHAVSDVSNSVKLNACSVDFAGLCGFLFTGIGQHANCELSSCTASFIGQDENKDTITANIGTAYAYSIDDVRGFSLTACGSESSNAILASVDCHNLRVDGISGLNMGHSDGTTQIDNNIKISGNYEQISLKNFNDKTPSAGGFATTVALSSPVGVNANNISMDSSISLSGVRFDGGDQPISNSPLLIHTEDLYEGRNRKGSGDKVKTGTKLTGSGSDDWYDQSDVLEQTFYVEVTGISVDLDLLQIDLDNGGVIGFQVEIIQTRDTSTATSSYVGFVHYKSSSATIQQPESLTSSLMAGSGTAPTLAFSASKLTATLPNLSTGYYIKVTALQKPALDYIRINWL